MTSDSSVEYQGFSASWIVSRQSPDTIYPGEGTLCHPGTTPSPGYLQMVRNSRTVQTIPPGPVTPVHFPWIVSHWTQCSALIPCFARSGTVSATARVTMTTPRFLELWGPKSEILQKIHFFVRAPVPGNHNADERY
jgi:hypothetical protein